MTKHNNCRKEYSLFQSGQKSAFEMNDITNKPSTKRRALASGQISMSKEAYNLVKNKQLPKGDALILAEIAGIQACKNASQTIPLCHPLSLDKVAITITLHDKSNSVTATCIASAFAKTGVEMEALAGVNGALLALYDLIKGVDAALYISDVLLEVKEGGKSGLWIHPNVQEKWAHLKEIKPFLGFKAAVITLSDRASCGDYEDLSGPEAANILKNLGAEVTGISVIPDDKEDLIKTLNNLTDNHVDLIISTGGTGISKRDITPDVLHKYCDRTLEGFGELLRKDGAKHTHFSWLSRSVAGVKNNSLLIALPGNPKAVKEGLQALQSIIPHAIKTLQKDSTKTKELI